MAQFEKKKIDLTQINGGNRYENGDALQAETINAAIEASAFAQSLVTNAPDTTEIAEGEPSFSIEGVEQGNPHIKVKGLQGKDGQQGERGEMGITPQLRINPTTEMWEISYDNGLTWASLGVVATGGARNISNGEGEYSLVMNDGLNTASGAFSTTLGDGNENEGDKCFVNGTQNKVLIDGATTPPNSCAVSGQLNEIHGKVLATTVGGYQNVVNNASNYSLIMGYDNTQNGGQCAGVIGTSNTTSASDSFVCGKNNNNSKEFSFVSGSSNKNNGTYSAVVGAVNTNNKSYSVLGGRNNLNNGTDAAIFGNGNANNPDESSAEGTGALISGKGNINRGRCNMVVGVNNENFGSGSGSATGTSLIGYGLRQRGYTKGESIVGKYNEEKRGLQFSVGNGTTDENRSNAFEVLTDGRAKVYGTPKEDDDVVRYGDVKNLGGSSTKTGWYKHTLSFEVEIVFTPTVVVGVLIDKKETPYNPNENDGVLDFSSPLIVGEDVASSAYGIVGSILNFNIGDGVPQYPFTGFVFVAGSFESDYYTGISATFIKDIVEEI